VRVVASVLWDDIEVQVEAVVGSGIDIGERAVVAGMVNIETGVTGRGNAIVIATEMEIETETVIATEIVGAETEKLTETGTEKEIEIESIGGTDHEGGGDQGLVHHLDPNL